MNVPIKGEDVADGFDPFGDIVSAKTPLGEFGATRLSNQTWEWFLVTTMRDYDDFDTIGDNGFSSLQECVTNADRQLRNLAIAGSTLTFY